MLCMTLHSELSYFHCLILPVNNTSAVQSKKSKLLIIKPVWSEKTKTDGYLLLITKLQDSEKMQTGRYLLSITKVESWVKRYKWAGFCCQFTNHIQSGWKIYKAVGFVWIFYTFGYFKNFKVFYVHHRNFKVIFWCCNLPSK